MKFEMKINSFENELGLLVQCLKLNGLWPYKNKYNNLKFSLCIIVAITGVFHGLYIIFNQKSSHNRILSMFQATLYFHTFMQRVVFKWNQSNFKTVFNYMDRDWKESNHLKSNDLNIMFNYVKKSRHVVKIIFMTFFTAGFGWGVNLLIEVFFHKKRDLLIFETWNAVTWDVTSSTKLLRLLFQLLATFNGLFGAATIDSCIVLLILHCCGQLEILCEKIKKFHGHLRHNLINRNKDCSNTVRIINNCSCLQCIVEKHNYLIHFVKVLDESIHGLMLLQLIPGTISFCTNGYGLIKSYTNGDISSMIYHIIYILAIMPIFLTLCSVSDDLLQKNENIKHMLYNLEWYNYNSRTKKLWIMMINHANTSIKITGGGFFVISLKCYKNWFINGVEYLSVLAAIMTRN